MNRVLRSPQALQDLLGIADTLYTRASPETAERFLRRAEESFSLLASFPLLGSVPEPPLPSPYQDVRLWTVKRFRKYVIFYWPLANGVQILRVLHGARDFHSVLGQETPETPL